MKKNARAFLESLYAESNSTDEMDRTSPMPRSPDELSSDWRELYEERAAIREFDGGQAREHAEAEAFGEILDRMRAAGELP